MKLCNRCLATETEESKILSELSRFQNRSLEELLEQVQEDEGSSLGEKAELYLKKRLEETKARLEEYEQALKQHEEELSFQIMDGFFRGEDIGEITEVMSKDEIREELEGQIRELRDQPQELTIQDLEKSLEAYIELGFLDLEGEKIKITPRGARKLANQILRRIFENLAPRQSEPHTIKEDGKWGTGRSDRSRKYEIGDEYERIDFEKTLLQALERHPVTQGKIKLELEDFQIYEEARQSRMIAGLIIDESESMAGDKINAAIDTGLALTELIRREPRDLLKVYLFSEEVREIPYYDILNTNFPEAKGATDIRAALYAFRKGVSSEEGDKQAYLITDAEPNFRDGKYVGFGEAIAGVAEEAIRYRQAGITLNIIMLDQPPDICLLRRVTKPKEFASILARRNLGRVFFVSPAKLEETVIEEYLTGKKENRFG
jgi:uncharacterized protein with von Willebrand factor type A (vWA) domain